MKRDLDYLLLLTYSSLRPSVPALLLFYSYWPSSFCSPSSWPPPPELLPPELLPPDLLLPDHLHPDILPPDLLLPDHLHPDIFPPDLLPPHLISVEYFYCIKSSQDIVSQVYDEWCVY